MGKKYTRKEVLDRLRAEVAVGGMIFEAAVGTGISATGENAERTHLYIRNTISDFTHPEVAENIRIIYGGSVNAANALELLRQENIDGALIGGASLKAGTFSDIVKVANSLVRH